MVIAYHIILTGYGHWLPNDVRGSMSQQVHCARLLQAGALHHGRESGQPTTPALQEFHRFAGQALHFPLLWWGPAARQALANVFGEIVVRENVTCHACAVLRNHVHFLFRKHRLKAEQISDAMKAAGRERTVELRHAPAGHPVFSADCCHIYKSTAQEVRNCIGHIWDNYKKHRLAPAAAQWVMPYDGWSIRS